MQAIKSSIWLVLLDGFTDMLGHYLEVTFVSYRSQRIDIRIRLLTEKVLRDLAAILDQLRITIAQAVQLQAVDNASFKDLPGGMIRSDIPEGSHPLGFGVSNYTVLSRIYVNLEVDEELRIGAIREI
ncbi:hypothetical protein [Pseudomonas citronellolis]|uniref:hypothetical protein n=1 Tax=Pseudomonas citronellolis TaxID=53408 RepID=UPI000778AF66|nr:hypothetical protein [Pseudomonas citronellolis]